MKIFDDNINLLIVLLFASLAYITIFKGHWSDKIKLTDVYNTDQRVKLSKNNVIDPIYSIEPKNRNFTVDGSLDTGDTALVSLVISLTELNRKKDQQTIKTAKLNLTGEKHQEIHQVFEYGNESSRQFTIVFQAQDRAGRISKKSIQLKKTKNFELAARNDGDFIIVLYPVLWIAFGTLVLVKITKLIRSNDPDKEPEKKHEEEEGYL